jgi:predicted chitinase
MLPTADDLSRLFPHARAGYFEALERNARLLAQHGLAESLPLCHFLAQAAHETGEFTIVEESGNYSAERLRQVWPNRFTAAQARAYAHKPKAVLARAYARAELGNGGEASGDGWTYRGRGLFQTTGKANYQRAGAYVGVDLVAKPDLLATDFDLGLKSALEEWSALDLSAVATRLGPTHEAVLAISRGINCGSITSSIQPNGLVERKRLFGEIWAALGHAAATPARLDPAADGVLEDGEQGDAVEALQKALAGLGYPIGEADGTFGARTHAAVAAFVAREPDIMAAVCIILPPGRWSMKWNDYLPTARPFENAARKDVTAADLAAKGDGVVTALGWLKTAGAGVAAFLGLDTAADKTRVQLPETLTGLREIVDPLASNLQWFFANKWMLGIAAAIGVSVLAEWGIRQLVARYRSFGIGGTST